MKSKLLLSLSASILALFFGFAFGRTIARQKTDPLVRIAELEIDPAQLENYKAALKEEIETSIRIEPGVLTLYAVAEKENPRHIRIFEMYADVNAYQAHLETPHFKKYKIGTQAMVKSLKLVETTPILLGAKSK